MKPGSGNLYRGLRDLAERTQESVARRLDVSQAWISQIELGKKTPEHPVELERELALGRRAGEESEPSYALGGFDRLERLHPLEPLAVARQRRVAHAVAALLNDHVDRQVVVLPVWRSYLSERQGDWTLLDDLGSVAAYLTAVSEGDSSRGTAVSGDLAATDHSAENP